MMSRIAAALLLAATAASAADGKLPVAVANMQKVTFESAPGKALRDNWQAYVTKRRGELSGKQVEVGKIRAELKDKAGTLTKDQKSALEKRADTLDKELEAINEDAQAEQTKIQANVAKLRKEADRILKDYAKANGIAVVFDSSAGQGEGGAPSNVIVLDPSADITDKLVELMAKVVLTADPVVPVVPPVAVDPKDNAPKVEVKIETTLGDITIELDREKAPITVANFLAYADAKHFDGTVFHRVIKDFMIQGGGMNEKMEEKPAGKPIRNEAANGLKNLRGTLAMARTGEIHSATAQFFISVKDNAFLDHKGAENYGYAVFGKVTKGMETVDKIVAVETANVGGHGDVPVKPVFIKSVRRTEPKKD